VCDGETVNFSNATTVPGGSVLFNIWHFGDGGMSFDVNTSHLYNTNGTYPVNLTVQSDKGCRDSLVQAVIVFKKPDVLITHNSPLAFCDGGDVTLAALPLPITNTYTYSWTTNETDSSIVVSTGGSFCVTVTDQNGCVDSACETVTVWALPVVTASSDVDSVSKGYTAHLMATGGASYQWSADPADPTLTTNIQSPTVAPLVTTIYTVTATDANGCIGTASVTITVNEDYFVHATNVITPNGDAYNQNWYIENILTYPNNEVLIFDRWGTLVYQKKAYDNTWEGTHDGKDLPQGTYFYVIKFDGFDKVYKGSVSIVR
jgi:gliding motility-associated-like protein